MTSVQSVRGSIYQYVFLSLNLFQIYNLVGVMMREWGILCTGTNDVMESMLIAGRYIYYEDLRVLSGRVQSSPQPLPPGLRLVNTPLIWLLMNGVRS